MKKFEECAKKLNIPSLSYIANLVYATKQNNDTEIDNIIYKMYKEAFEAGQNDGKDWIPVTERLPTEKDGKIDKIDEWNFGFGDIDDGYVGDPILQILTSDGETVHENIYDLDKKEFTAEYNVIKWQPLPEA